MLNNNNIKIAMLDMSPQNKAILEFYFDRAGKSLYKVVNEASADALIIDYDQYGAKDHLTEILADRKIPILLVSIKEQEIPSTVWVAKPLSADALDKAAVSIKELSTEIETETKAAEAEAEKAKQKDESVEVLTDVHLEEDESLLNETIQEFTDIEEQASSEKPLEIDEMVLEENEAEENNLVNAGLAIAGAGALVSTALTTEDTDLDGDLTDFNEIDNIQQSTEDTLPELTDTLNEDSIIDSNEDDVDFLLDSLISEEDQSPDAPSEEIEDDVFVNNLSENNELEIEIEEAKSEQPDFDVEIESTNNTDINLEMDVLQSVDSELEDNFDLQKSIETKAEDSHKLVDDKTSLVVEEDFTMHDDHEPSTEDVYADTLEVNYAEVKSDTEESKTENVSSSSLDETLNDDFLDFDFESQETTDTVIEPSLDSEDNFELTLLEDVDAKAEVEVKPEPESDTDILEENYDNDLDSLLNEVSNENIESSLTAEEELAQTEATVAVIEDLERSDLDEINNNDLDEELADTDLQSLLNEVREEADKSLSGDTGSENAFEQTEAEKRWMQLCGNETTISNQKEVTKITFDPNKHLLSVILEQIKSPKNEEQLFRLKYKDLIVVIDHATSKVYCNTSLSSDEYSVVCFNEIDVNKVKIHDLDYSEVRLYRSKIEKNPQRTHSFESFIWTTSLLTSRGRLPQSTSVTKNIGLKTWPNLTRLEMLPNAMNVAAVFAKHPGSLLEIPKWLKIQQRYVFAFYNAALSLDMIELDGSKLKKSGFSFGKKDNGKKSEERGFFGRLLKRLKS